MNIYPSHIPIAGQHYCSAFVDQLTDGTDSIRDEGEVLGRRGQMVLQLQQLDADSRNKLRALERRAGDQFLPPRCSRGGVLTPQAGKRVNI